MPSSTDQSQPCGSTTGPTGEGRGPKFSKTEHEHKLLQAALLERRGYNQYDIARMIGVTQGQVGKYLAKNRRRYQEAVLDLEASRMFEMLDHYKDVRREAWEAWEITKGGAIRSLIGELAQKMELAIATGTELPKEIVVKLRAQPANEFLTTILKSLDAESDLLGLTAKPDPDAGKGAAKAALWDALVAAAPEGAIPDDIEGRVMRPLLASEVQTADPVPAPVSAPESPPYKEGNGQLVDEPQADCDEID